MEAYLFLFKAFFMSLSKRAKYQQLHNSLSVVVDRFVKSITKRSNYGDHRNYIYASNELTGRITHSFVEVVKKLSKAHIDLYMECYLRLNFSNDSVNGFTVNFIYSEFKECCSRGTFRSAKEVFLREGILLPIDGFKDWFIVNPALIYKGYAKQPERDYNSNIIDYNNNVELNKK